MGSEQSEAFLVRLFELQEAAGLSDQELARRLGFSHPYVNRLRRRVRGKRLSVRFIFAAAAAFPELHLLLPGGMPNSTDAMMIDTDVPALEQDEENPPEL